MFRQINMKLRSVADNRRFVSTTRILLRRSYRSLKYAFCGAISTIAAGVITSYTIENNIWFATKMFKYCRGVYDFLEPFGEFLRQCGLGEEDKSDKVENPVEFVKFEDFIEHGSMPRFDEIKRFKLVNIDRDNSLMIFVSHRWIRPDKASGKHPDNEAGDKFKLCVKGITKIKQTYAPIVKNCYLWIDYSCVDQDKLSDSLITKTVRSEASYDEVMKVCDAVFTPIVDNEHKSWNRPVVWSNRFTQYQAESWNNLKTGYLHSGWCRCEMLYAAHIPVMHNSDGSRRESLFKAGLAHFCSLDMRAHFVYGTKEDEVVGVPFILPSLKYTHLSDYHPMGGNYTVESDRKNVRSLWNKLRPYIKSSAYSVGYKGGTNMLGEPHIYGVRVYDNGNIYKGEWKNGEKHGKGTITFGNGDVYEGNFENNIRSGFGIFRYHTGDVYVGEWKDSLRHGHGVYKSTDGTVFDGHHQYNLRHGEGKEISADGKITKQGKWIEGKYIGN